MMVGNYGCVIREIRETVKSFFSCNFCHELRASNVEAHTRARYDIPLSQGRHLWLGSPRDLDVIP
uniref:Uncharacterized protein n=1 Tax=Aegilops tauschii subsp. strangulata TaxID=200361 RepID=A0A453PT57_AEGTS